MYQCLLENITLKSSSRNGIIGLGSPYFHKFLRMIVFLKIVKDGPFMPVMAHMLNLML